MNTVKWEAIEAAQRSAWSDALFCILMILVLAGLVWIFSR